MANLTVTIDDELLRRARQRALARGVSVNALVRDYLSSFADAEEVGEAARRFVEISEQAASGSGSGGRTWRRDDLYER
jgi:plasmid stability protein